jgi:hypothetical protein
MKRRNFFADVWDKVDLSEKKRLMSQVRKNHGNNYSEKQLYSLLEQEYQNSISPSCGSDDLKN